MTERGLSPKQLERRREERLYAYSEFLAAVNQVSHEIGNLSETMHEPADDARWAAYGFDTEVTPRFQMLELVASDRALEAARTLYEALRTFRAVIGNASPEQRPDLGRPEYDAFLDPMLKARDAFVSIARDEMR